VDVPVRVLTRLAALELAPRTGFGSNPARQASSPGGRRLATRARVLGTRSQLRGTRGDGVTLVSIEMIRIDSTAVSSVEGHLESIGQSLEFFPQWGRNPDAYGIALMTMTSWCYAEPGAPNLEHLDENGCAVVQILISSRRQKLDTKIGLSTTRKPTA
jgi:hypothetical protein